MDIDGRTGPRAAVAAGGAVLRRLHDRSDVAAHHPPRRRHPARSRRPDPECVDRLVERPRRAVHGRVVERAGLLAVERRAGVLGSAARPFTDHHAHSMARRRSDCRLQRRVSPDVSAVRACRPRARLSTDGPSHGGVHRRPRLRVQPVPDCALPADSGDDVVLDAVGAARAPRSTSSATSAGGWCCLVAPGSCRRCRTATTCCFFRSCSGCGSCGSRCRGRRVRRARRHHRRVGHRVAAADSAAVVVSADSLGVQLSTRSRRGQRVRRRCDLAARRVAAAEVLDAAVVSPARRGTVSGIHGGSPRAAAGDSRVLAIRARDASASRGDAAAGGRGRVRRGRAELAARLEAGRSSSATPRCCRSASPASRCPSA